MEVDVIVVGAGIQGLILSDKLRKSGLDIVCISDDFIGGVQTLQSQFYLHRGHFYKEVELASTLNENYPKWCSLIQEMNLETKINQSYVGFDSELDENLWVTAWRKASLPFEKAQVLPQMLKNSRGTFYTFPHILFSGQALIDGLVKKLESVILLGNIVKMKEREDGHQEIDVMTEGKKKTIKAKYIVLCAGAGNHSLTELLDSTNKVIPRMQKRFCQVLVLEGKLPPVSILLPGLKMFIASQYSAEKTYWLYTFGTDPLIITDKVIRDSVHVDEQAQTIFNFFPLLRTITDLKASTYTATKIESADLGAGNRPNKAFVHQVTPRVISIWPTKLSLAFEASEAAFNYMQFPNTQANIFLNMGKQNFLVQTKCEEFDLFKYTGIKKAC